MKTTDTVIFYFTPNNANSGNDGKRIAAALPLGHDAPGRGTTENLDLFVLASNAGWGAGPQPDIPHATTLADALTGDKWSSIPEAQGWGIDLSDGDQNIEALLNIV